MAERDLLRRRADTALVLLAFGHGGLLLAAPVLPVVALGVWWNSNTVAHYFLHTPFFRARPLNILFALYLSALLGIPQSVWRERHLAHHAGAPPRFRFSHQVAAEIMLIATIWGSMLAFAPGFFLTVYAPGYILGLTLCALHGHYEHQNGRTVSHYGLGYNWLFLNDGYHAEHHANPQSCWAALPALIHPDAVANRWPAILRWLDACNLDGLERLVLRFPWLQKFVLHRHERALGALLSGRRVARAAIVGGGLFPRSALLLHRLIPDAELVVIDRRIENLDIARALLPEGVEVVHDWYDPERHRGYDLVVIPLAYVGDRAALYRQPPAPLLLVHDWVWRPRGTSRVVSWVLLKRLNLMQP